MNKPFTMNTIMVLASCLTGPLFACTNASRCSLTLLRCIRVVSNVGEEEGVESWVMSDNGEEEGVES